jgi:hypothetical protein
MKVVANRLRYGCYLSIGDHGTALPRRNWQPCHFATPELRNHSNRVIAVSWLLPTLWLGAAYAIVFANNSYPG